MKRSTHSTALATVIDLLEIQQEQLERHENKNDLWRRQPMRFLVRGLLHQLTESAEIFGRFKDEPLDPKTAERFERICANGANYFAFLAARVRALAYVESAPEGANDSIDSNATETTPEETLVTTETAA